MGKKKKLKKCGEEMRADTVWLQEGALRRPCFSWPRGWKVLGGKAQGDGGLPCPGHLEGLREPWPLWLFCRVAMGKAGVKHSVSNTS